MSYLYDLSLELSMSSVFVNLKRKPLLVNFFKITNPAFDKLTKILAYSDFISEIYNNGASLTDYVSKLVFEDENVYIKSLAKFGKCNDIITDNAFRELDVFSRFASLTPEIFKKELDVEVVADFLSYKTNLKELYATRVKNIAKLGYGIFSSCPMFRLSDNMEIEPIISADRTKFDKFVGYEDERSKIVENTNAFIKGVPAANVLLCGDAGTGKSSTVKAIINEFFDEGLRLIELRKDQLSKLPYIMGKISDNPLKFIIFIDDLSFNKSDDNFSMLKAALEGSASSKSDNALIYATSNRRHIIKESFSDRDGNDVHINDTMQEILSLSERFGLVVLFSKPGKELYLRIVHELAQRNNIKMSENELNIAAESYALRRGNRSARCAEQFVASLIRA